MPAAVAALSTAVTPDAQDSACAARLTLDAVPSGRGWAGAYEGDVGKQSWTGIPKAEITKRLGELLAVEFVEREELGPGGTATRIATLDNDAWVALEIERSHARPVHNVLRYWPWMDRTRRRLVVVHAILPDAPQQHGPRTELTIWTGELMERVLGGRFTYCRVEPGRTQRMRSSRPHSMPSPCCADRRRRAPSRRCSRASRTTG